MGFFSKFKEKLGSKEDYEILDCRNYFTVRIKTMNILIAKEEPFQRAQYVQMYTALTALLEGEKMDFRSLLM